MRLPILLSPLVLAAGVALSACEGEHGQTGPQGVDGADGAPGAPGAPGFGFGPPHVVTSTIGLGPGVFAGEFVDCPVGEYATGGGWTVESNGIENWVIAVSHPLFSQVTPNAIGPTGWSVRGQHSNTGPRTFTVYAICIAVY